MVERSRAEKELLSVEGDVCRNEEPVEEATPCARERLRMDDCVGRRYF